MNTSHAISLCLTLLLAAAVASAQAPTSFLSCQSTIPTELGTTRLADSLGATPNCVALTLPDSGTLLAEAVTRLQTDAWLEVAPCGGPASNPPLVLERQADYAAIFFASGGRIRLCVSSPDPTQDLSEIRLETAFLVDQTLVKNGTDPDAEPDPDPGPDPDLDEPDGWRSPPAFDCSDLADTRWCASGLMLGEVRAATLDNTWNDDLDRLILRVDHLSVVRLEAESDVPITLSLKDSRGHILERREMAPDQPIGRALVLNAGTYFVDLSQSGAVAGSYRLRVTELR